VREHRRPQDEKRRAIQVPACPPELQAQAEAIFIYEKWRQAQNSRDVKTSRFFVSAKKEPNAPKGWFDTGGVREHRRPQGEKRRRKPFLCFLHKKNEAVRLLHCAKCNFT